jgi:hypothetical protein
MSGARGSAVLEMFFYRLGVVCGKGRTRRKGTVEKRNKKRRVGST